MSKSPLTRPLEGDALRIQQLQEKLAQVHENQRFFDASKPGKPGHTTQQSMAPISPGSKSVRSSREVHSMTFDEAISPRSLKSNPLEGSSLHLRTETDSRPIKRLGQRQAPVIQPTSHATNRDGFARRDTRLKTLNQEKVPNGHDVSEDFSSIPDFLHNSEVLPFLYQDLSHTPTESPSYEHGNPFDTDIHDIPLANPSPLNPSKDTVVGAQLSRSNTNSRGRRDAADLTAGVNSKSARGFFNNLIHKKKGKSGLSSALHTEDRVTPEQFTSPFDQSRPRPYHQHSSLSLRLPHSRRQTFNFNSETKNSPTPSKPVSEHNSASGVVLDTDLSHMSGILTATQRPEVMRPDYSINPRTSSVATAEDFGEAAWAPPESWAVKRQDELARADPVTDDFDPLDDPLYTKRKESHISAVTNASEGNSKKGPNHQMRIYRGDWTFATVACGLHTTTESLMTILGRKFFLPSVANYQILMERNGLSRILQTWEKPFILQKTLLEEAGYTEADRLEEMGRDDNSYLCRFIFTTCSVPSFSLEADSAAARHEHYDLSGRNVETIPILLYKHAGTLKSLDVSRNLSLDIPIDFIQSCPRLTSITCLHNEAVRLPGNIIHAESLQYLDVSFNRMTELHEHINQLAELTSLTARNNRLSNLPKSMGLMQNMTRLNLSSNLFKTFPQEICDMVTLQDLDLSFNRLTAVPETIGNLTKLQRLLLNNNKLLGTLPRAFSKLSALREVDLRFNHLTTLDVLSACPLLESISAGHNAVTVVESSFPSARLFQLTKCPVTKFSLDTCGLTLTSLDLSNAKLPSIPDAMFDNLTNLVKLILDNNHFTYLPPQLGKLKHLQHLSCTSNQISVLPEEIGDLSELRILDVHSNNLKTIPPQTWLLTELVSLNASSNLLTTFPEPPVNVTQKESAPQNGLSPVVEEHTFDPSRKNSAVSIHARSSNTMAQSLKYLFLGDNRMDEQCFDSISLLQELRVLNLSFNELYEVPTSGLRRLHHLVELYLSGNELTSLPADDLEQMQALRVLHINANKLQTLPAEIGKIRRLLVLDVGSNALKYNTANWPYDWNWNWNLDLKYLNLSGNKRLEIKPSNNANVRDRNLSDFNALTKLRVLGLMDITLTIDSVPEENENRRVRLSGSDISDMSYGQADTLGRHDHLSIIDVVIPRFRGQDEEAVFGMFDGSEVHDGGSKISKHLQDFFSEHIAIELKRLRKDEEVPAALRRAFLAFNKELGALVTPIPVKNNSETTASLLPPASHRPSVISQQSSNTFAGPYVPVTLTANDRTAGAAVCLAYIVGKRVYIANVGDTLALLSKADGEAKLLSVKHNAGDSKEVNRIREAGGYVSRDGLVNDQLDVTRSMGYFDLAPLIQAAPHIETIDLTEEDEFIIIASKSLWDVMSFQTAVDIARSEHEDLMLAAQKLRDFAISYGSSSKISVMIIGVGDLFHKKAKLLNMRGSSTGRNTAGGYLVADEDLLLGQVSHKSRRRVNDDQPADSTLARLTREVPPPVGEVAMVFTDIKNSTLLWETHPVAMRSAIKIHNSIMRRQLRSIGGYEVKTEGDAFMVCFPTTTSALLWCLTVQTQLLVADWPQEILESADGRDIYDDTTAELIYRGISVRMGMHWGSPVCEVDPITRRMDYFGPMVNRAARISGVADGGQITVSADVVRDLDLLEQLHKQYTEHGTTGKISEVQVDEQAMLAIKKDMQMLKRIGFGISPLGERRLKGLENAEFISLAYPKTLRGRLTHVEKAAAELQKSSFIGPRVLDHRHIVDVYAVVFRLENLCSMIRGNKPKTENRVNVLRGVIANAYSKEDDDMRLAAVLENLLTRVENAMAALTLHYTRKSTEALVANSGMNITEIIEAIRLYRIAKDEQSSLRPDARTL